MYRNMKLTSEAVSEGHPDKIADQLSDAVLDAYLEKDPDSRTAIECMICDHRLIIAGEVNSRANITDRELQELSRNVISRIGYDRKEFGFDPGRLVIENLIHEQSPNIASGIEDGGAGDQGIMFGYACRETDDFMPLAITLARQMLQKHKEIRNSDKSCPLGPDAKSQVTLIYENAAPTAIDSIIFSTQHNEDISLDELRDFVREHIILPILPASLDSSHCKYYINPAGEFHVGGPVADTGLTGRKLIADTYGGSDRHGGGAFSGKDASKVDRSGAYAARHLATNIVASGMASQCSIQLSYAIGIEQPIAIMLDLHGSGKVNEERLVKYILSNIDLSPMAIIKRFNMKKLSYYSFSSGGHFGRRELKLPWETLDYVGDFMNLM